MDTGFATLQEMDPFLSQELFVKISKNKKQLPREEKKKQLELIDMRIVMILCQHRAPSSQAVTWL